MDDARAVTTTILFSDLVNSTELMQRAGDEDAQRLFRAHYQLLRDAVSASGGAEVKSLGDGLMVAFASAADAVRCAIAMQQMSRRPVAGERLAIRVGLNAGDALRDEGDYFGTTVVTARRLCDRAGPGQILCGAVVQGLLAGRQAFSFQPIGDLELKGLPAPVAACEVSYEAEQPGLMLTRTPFVGREAESARLSAKLGDARAGHGGLAMLVGEPGIGKSRMIEEFSERARADGATVLTGACFEGEWSPPYAPFVEAIGRYAAAADPAQLRTDLGAGAPAIARLVPAVREALPDLPEPPALQPDEERFRLLDAVAQFLAALSSRQPVVLVLDDLHWAERGTIAMLRHVARSAPKQRLLVLGAYRDVELDRQHPLADALAQLRREAEYERIALKGLSEEQVGSLLTAITEQDVPAPFIHAISDETDGNPFFIREVLIHLADEGKIFQRDGRWTSDLSIEQMGIPEGVRQVIGRRLSRLPESANRLLTAASGVNGPFRLEVAAAAAGVDEADALDAIDAALDAQLVRPAGSADTFEFTHALIRHTLYAELSPPRQVRLHRQIAEAMERVLGDLAGEHAAELAYQFARSAGLAGTERGVAYALQAADRAKASYAYDEEAQFLRIALDLLPESDASRPRLLARYSSALMWTLRYDESVTVALEAAKGIAASDGDQAAAKFVAWQMYELNIAGSLSSAWRLAEVGLVYAHRRDKVWAQLAFYDGWHRQATDPNAAGSLMPMDSPFYDEFIRVMRTVPPEERHRPATVYESREEVLEVALPHRGTRDFDIPLGLQAGEFRLARERIAERAIDDKSSGRPATAAGMLAMVSRFHTALGEFDAAREAYGESLAQAAKLEGDPLLGAQSIPAQQVVASLDELRLAQGIDPGDNVALVRSLLGDTRPEFMWARAAIEAAGARIYAFAGHADASLAALASLAARLDRIPAWDANNIRALCDAAHALWLLERTDHDEVIERNLLQKVIAPDFRYPNFDGRLAMARLCGVSGRFDEAREWFSRARVVLEEQGARPLRAMCDYDEAVLFARRGAEGDTGKAAELLALAITQMRDIGMTGWLERAEALRRDVGTKR